MTPMPEEESLSTEDQSAAGEFQAGAAGRARPRLLSGWRVGVYGGSFDPVHAGHIEPVLAAIDAQELDHVLFLPTAFPPHKRDVEQVPAALRFEMVRLALADVDQVTVLDDEMAAEPSYSIDTLERLSSEYPRVEFVLVIGADSYCDLPKWREWQRIVAGWDMVVLPRPGWSLEVEALPKLLLDEVAQHPDRTHTLMESPQVDASSTEIRLLLRSGRPVPDGWLAEPVLDFIRARDLYGALHRDEVEPPIEASETDTFESESGLTAHSSAPDTAAAAAADEAETPATTMPLPPEVALAAYTALDRQARDLSLLEVTAVCDFADYFLVCTGNTDRQVSAIADAIQRALRKTKVKPLHVEGQRRGNWVLIDYGHLIVHIFDPSTRDFYRLERLWDDAPRVPASLYETMPTSSSVDATEEE